MEKSIVKRETVDVVAQRVRKFQESGQLHLPENYSAENAMKSAWLTIQETVDKDKRTALSVCTRESIANALLNMVVQALNPAKKQCYFVVYGKQLVCQRSYFGSMSVAKMVDPSIADIAAEVVYEGDTFKYQIDRGRKYITVHEQELGNIGKPIVAAYCVVLDRDGNIRKTEIMTWDQITQAWRQSQTKPVNDNGTIKAGSTHAKFPADMALKTVINKCCKPIINATSDSNLLLDAVHRADDAQAEYEVEQEIKAKANQDMLDVHSGGEIVDAEYPDAEEHGIENDPPVTEEEAAEIEAREKAEAATEGPGY